MKKLFYCFCISLILFNCDNKENNKEAINEPVMDKNTTEMTKKLRHVVLFKFNESASAEDINNVEMAFEALPSKIKEIEDLEWGLNNSPEGINKGFTHCFFVTFDSEEARAIYLPHPEHKAFVDVLSPHLDDVLVIDYWTK